MRVCLGGTFDPFHVGHERLLQRAVDLAGPDGHVFVGLVSDAFSAGKRARRISPFADRRATLEAWLGEHAGTTAVTVRTLEDPYGPSATGDYDALVVSVETQHTGAQINAKRKEADLKPLIIEVVPYVLAQDLLPISATRVASGRIDREGQRLVPLDVAVGSANPVKVEAVRRVFARAMPDIEVRVIGHDVASGVDEQPFDHDTHAGAANRAGAALDAGQGDGAEYGGAEYGVGIEAGLVADPVCEGWLDVQHCVIVDASGHVTHGHGAGFHHPRVVEGQVALGVTVGDAYGPLAEDADIGRTQGAVGWLSRGLLDRTRLTEQAVEAALVPRIQRSLYDTGRPE